MTLQVVFRSGAIALVQSVRAYFAANGVTATVPKMGRRERTKIGNQGPGGANRVVFAPCDDSGKGGTIVAPHIIGGRDVSDSDGNVVATVRALRTWERSLLVSVWAVDSTTPDDEELQLEAVEALFEWTVRAVNAFAPGSRGAAASLEWGDTQWTSPADRAFGMELRVALKFRHPIFDVPQELAFPSSALTKHPLQQEALCVP